MTGSGSVRRGFVPAPPPPPPAPVVAVLDLEACAEAVRELAAVGGAAVAVHPAGATPSGRDWPAPPGLVLLDGAAALRLSRSGMLPPPGARLIVVGDVADEGLDAVAAQVGATRTARLPHAQAWLAATLAEACEPSQHPCAVIAVRGCVPAVTALDSGQVTAALALTVARPASGLGGGPGCLALDADPASGGLDLRLAAEAVPGARWPDLAGARGRLPVGFLPGHLPLVAGVSVLSAGRRPAPPLPPDTADAVLAAAWRSYGLVVADLGASTGGLATAVQQRADHLVLVVPPGVTALAAARRCLADLAEQPVVPPVHALVQQVRGWTARTAVDVLQEGAVPLASWVPVRVGAAARRAAMEAVPPLLGGRSRLGAACRELVASIAECGPGEPVRPERPEPFVPVGPPRPVGSLSRGGRGGAA